MATPKLSSHSHLGVKTRCTVNCPVLGAPAESTKNVLPMYEQILKYYAWIRFQKKENKKEPTFNEIADVVAVKLEHIWKKASIPTVSRDRILKMLRTFHTKYMNLIKPYKERQNKISYQEKVRSFQTETKGTLFDIASCKCDLSSTMTLCSCDKLRKFPAEERLFSLEQE